MNGSNSPRQSILARPGAIGVLAVVVILLVSLPLSPVGALLILLWARLTRTALSELGFVRPNNWISGLVIGLLLGVCTKLLMKVVVLPLLGVSQTTTQFERIHGDPRLALLMVGYVIVFAAFGEETVFRGFLFERLTAWFGRSLIAQSFIVVLTGLAFGALHFQQGVYGVVNGAIMGVFLGTLYLLKRRRLWTVMVTHAAFDLTSIAIIYWGFEGQLTAWSTALFNVVVGH